ncbi:MAG: phosphatidylinositol-3-phosphatase, partial [Thermoleophilaceae bacterium]|nr:phosphatidylinositol-3-phosphatase [Thermoleophilaceae bacterium]
MRQMRRVLPLLALTISLAAAAPAHAATPPVKHVFIVVLENENFDSTFAANSKAPYLSKTLRSRGAFLSQYYGTAHLSLPNYIAMTSGQGPNPVTQSDCQFYQEFAPGTIGPDGQAVGQGCLYPATVKTIADQLEAKGLDWKGYMEDMQSSCLHPGVNSKDGTQSAKVGNQYAARHNPFVYFRSIIDRPVCSSNDVPLDRLQGDLATNSVGSYNFITPNLCNDGHDEPCVDGRPGGLASMDEFLKLWVPRITGSKAYKDGGLLMVTFDEAEADETSGSGDASSCCDEPAGPNTPNNGGPTPGNGGGLTGAVLLSPYIAPGTVTATPYNHYSMLRS